ncbi:hypothetical protein ACEXQD_17135 [Herbiconiux sp. P15]|uniref:hypothetical protein n=1 Tax=Herbiconiux liukaitaii TaxID=3342799 RepID=UPI0035B758B4
MTAERWAISGARPIEGFSPFLAIPGGVALGALNGFEFGIVTLATSFMSSPEMALGGLGGLFGSGAVIGAVAGMGAGLVVGAAVALVAWLVLLVHQAVLPAAVVGGMTTSAMVLVLLGAIGLQIQDTLILALWSGIGAFGGLLLILWFAPARHLRQKR